MSEEQKPEEKQEEKVDKDEWDKSRQELEQVQANYEKATAENAAITEQLESKQLEIDSLNESIKAKEEQKSDIELDPDMVDKNVIKSITQMKSELKSAKDELKDLKSYAAEHKQVEQQRAEKVAEDDAVRRMCEAIEEDYDPQHRNEAIALAKKLVKDGKEPPVSDGIDGMKLMRKCYKQLSEKAKPEDVPTDKGGGGGPSPPSTRKEGTEEEVLADMKKDQSWRDDPVEIDF